MSFHMKNWGKAKPPKQAILLKINFIYLNSNLNYKIFTNWKHNEIKKYSLD